MKRSQTLLVWGLVITGAFGGAAQTAVAAKQAATPNIEELVDKTREKQKMILVFTNNKNDPRYIEQMSALSSSRDLVKEKDLAIISAFRSDKTAQPVFEDYGIGQNKTFMAILVDRGGAVKVRSERPLLREDLAKEKDTLESKSLMNQPTMDPVVPEPNAIQK